MDGYRIEDKLMNAGIVDIPEAEYRKHPSLSQSGIKLLLPPSCPALFRWRMDNPEPHKKVFDFGNAAHKEVLGIGQPVRYIQGKTAKGEPSDGWASKYAQDQAAEARAAGEIPLLESQRGVIEGMAAALRAHPLAAKLLDPEHGKPEQALFHTDPDSGIGLRGRLDWLPNASSNGRMVLPDYKTAASADAESFANAAASYGYVIQDPFYRDLVTGAGLADEVDFVFIVQSKEPPFLVNVIELDAEAVRIGRGLIRKAINLYKACLENDYWPGYGSDVELVSVPVWFQRLHEDFTEMSL